MSPFANRVKRWLVTAALTLTLSLAVYPSAQAQYPGIRPTVAPPAPTVKHAPAPPARDTPAPTIANLQRSYSQERSWARWGRLSKQDQDYFNGYYHQARSAEEKAYLYRALGMGHSLTDLKTFAETIRGKSDDWARNNLRLVNSTRNYGVKQQWKDSCMPAVVQAFLGHLDPVYSLKVRAANPSFYECDDAAPLRYNPNLARDQKHMLELANPSVAGGGAVARNARTGGKGSHLELLNLYTARTGLRFGSRVVGADYPVSQALKDIDLYLSKRVPVPLGVATGKTGHAVLVLGAWEEKGQRGYIIHDPWSGRTVNRTAAQFLRHELNLAGNHRLVVMSVITIASLD